MALRPPSDGFILPVQTAQRSGPSGQNKRKPSLRLARYIPGSIRNHVIAVVGEFIGTFLFLFFAFSATQAVNSTPPAHQHADPARLLYISLAFGFSLAVNAWAFFRITGGLFNPAVSFALALIGEISRTRACLVTVAQLLGAIVSAAVVSALFPGQLAVQTTLGNGATIPKGLFIEMFLTAELVFTICMLAAEKSKATFIAPVGIGLSLFIAELSGVYFTGGSLNPARSFGPCVAAASFTHYHWIYWVGPLLGSLLAVGFYKLVKAIEYETLNPDADADEEGSERFKSDGPADAQLESAARIPDINAARKHQAGQS